MFFEKVLALVIDSTQLSNKIHLVYWYSSGSGSPYVAHTYLSLELA